MTLTQAAVLAVIEGLTEFLPVSSTGHMIMAAAAMKIHENEFVKSFEIAIQLGAVLSIVLIYARQFVKGLTLHLKLLAAFLPTAVIGFLAYKIIKTYLFNPIVVAVSLMLGGIVLILVDRRTASTVSATPALEQISYRNAFFIGLAQCVSMIPGVSRAAATIIGGIFNGLDKKQATEFSFLLAVPTMCAATGYDLLKTPLAFSSDEIKLLLFGSAAAFVVAGITVLAFRRVVERHGFKHFGYYRITVGLIYLLTMT